MRARVLFEVRANRMILLQGFIEKSRKTPGADLEVARRRSRALHEE
ncbi:MAG: type II toxin-antitoxin system RelE/ParE family toxin [Armatimonadetes bacterium]|nr:type II toxin-antitoxin system RelE/ParE family toxin [Armatimonadota bacterium]